MGGEGDSAFFKGHRKTYIGAYPGKIISALKES
jgi:ATP-dependent Lon protease